MEKTEINTLRWGLWFYLVKSEIWELVSCATPVDADGFEEQYSAWFGQMKLPPLRDGAGKGIKESGNLDHIAMLAVRQANQSEAQNVYGWVAGGIYLEHLKRLQDISSAKEFEEKKAYLMEQADRQLDLSFQQNATYGQEKKIILKLIADRIDDFARRLRLLPSSRMKQRTDSMRALLIGSSKAFETVLAQAEQVAAFSINVLLTGETGVGKELFAAYIHGVSSRSDGPFIPVNCAAISSHLFESELFGHERGAFTGAVASKKGMVEAAHTGTLFLDEVGDLQPEHQAKLLRFLQERKFRRVGSTREEKSDVRIIAATNRNLLEAVKEGTFRSDLFYRLCAYPIHLPPLRERTEDIALLAHHFLQVFSARESVSEPTIAKEALDRLLAYRWPGNIRELKNVVEQAAIRGRGRTIEIRHLPLELEPSRGFRPGTGLRETHKTRVNTERFFGAVRYVHPALRKRNYFEAYVTFHEKTEGKSFRLGDLVDFFSSLDIGTEQSRVKFARTVLNESCLVYGNRGKTRQNRFRLAPGLLNEPLDVALPNLDSLLLEMADMVTPESRFLTEDVLIEQYDEPFGAEAIRPFTTPDVIGALVKKKSLIPTSIPTTIIDSTCIH